MGIPSFFSYIIKQHKRNVLHDRIPANIRFSYLFIDANSLIYDVYNRLLKNTKEGMGAVSADVETTIIDAVGDSIDALITQINPTIKTYIAFDGVCPLAKMKHQRTRRLKSYVLKELPIAASPQHTPPFTWDTTNITPGTPFMQKLSRVLGTRYATGKVHFSGADIIGEGESKICHYMRQIGHENGVSNKPICAFYGLDNDIIMLSILHLYCVDNIFVFREDLAPQRKNDSTEEKKSPQIFINIRTLVDSILYEMNCEDRNKSRVIDYVFMCFFLGNDFLPRFPAIQIRTHGITLLLDIYREHIGKFHGRRLVTSSVKNAKGGVGGSVGVINWGWVSIFIQKLATCENEFFILEDDFRDKMEASLRRTEGAIDDPENMPILYREVERYVSPKVVGWESRYYAALFDCDSTATTPTPTPKRPALIRDACNSYLRGLEWVFTYYTGNCPDWRWVYPHAYPPLLRDLTMHVPRAYNWRFYPNVVFNPYSAEEQLDYVMPPVGQTAEEKARMISNLQWRWAYCRYLWESHLERK
jgi:5'-3' exonuclease